MASSAVLIQAHCRGFLARNQAQAEQFVEWAASVLRGKPCYEQYKDLVEQCILIIAKWKDCIRSKKIWLRMVKGDRLLKELNECLPILARTIEYVNALDLKEGQKAIILDVCSGFGYMSMFLSELLPPEKVDRIVLMDRMWAIYQTKELSTHHMNWDHLFLKHWPIPLHARRFDLKSRSERVQLEKYVTNTVEGPTIMVAMHLCGLLSIRAVELFNTRPHAGFLALKPCCLPPTTFIRNKVDWKIEGNSDGHVIYSKDVCAAGKYSLGKWVGPPKHNLIPKFRRWAKNLYLAADPGPDGRKTQESIDLLEEKSHFQTEFIFAVRDPWTGVLPDTTAETGKAD